MVNLLLSQCHEHILFLLAPVVSGYTGLCCSLDAFPNVGKLECPLNLASSVVSKRLLRMGESFKDFS